MRAKQFGAEIITDLRIFQKEIINIFWTEKGD
jgi:hypothetical protein